MVSFNPNETVLLYRVINVLGQTLVYGIYLSLISILTYVMTRNGLEAQTHRIVFALMWFMFALSTMYWISSVVITFWTIVAWFSRLDPSTHNPPGWLPMVNAVLLINYIITDGVVVWRAWVLCADQSTAVLMIPVVTLIINFLFYATTVGVRGALFIVPGGLKAHRILARIIDIAQVSNLGLSLLTNVLATSIIAYKAWKYRKSLSQVFGHKTSQASKILFLLIESGMLYIVIGVSLGLSSLVHECGPSRSLIFSFLHQVLNLASLVIHLPSGTLGDIFQPVAVQLAGMYPIAVLLLVHRDRSLNHASSHAFSTVVNISREQRSHMEPMTFVPGPTIIDKTGPQIPSVHLAFGSMVELGDMDASEHGAADPCNE
ncbi:hypothetical protein BJV78DRAFT_1371651 [Lactifluus subvellereus]|nr:hypothetical protein BJV78DRAFT_1371651 [Lactifluus subvellereus]